MKTARNHPRHKEELKGDEATERKSNGSAFSLSQPCASASCAVWPFFSGEQVSSCCQVVGFQSQDFLLWLQIQAFTTPSVSFLIGSMDTEVTQSPSHLIKGKGEKAKMDCVPKEGHAYVYWYRKKLEEAFEFLVYFQNEDPMEETAVFKQRFSAECPKNSPCSLEIKSTEAADSALYFCASSQSTVQHVSSS